MARKKSSATDVAAQVANGGTCAPEKVNFDPEMLVPSGSTNFNLACSDSIHGAFALGGYVNIIGDSSSGKTFSALSVFSECATLLRFYGYRFIHDDVENRQNFDIPYLFGSAVADRLEAPAYDEHGDANPSETTQHAMHNILTALEHEKPCIYILDSWDGLDDMADQAKVAEVRDAIVKDKEAKGTYGMAKAKSASQILRTISRKLKRSNSLLIIVSQTRDNIDPMSFAKKTRSGGRALKFYCNHEVWMACGSVIKGKGEKGKDIAIGVNSKLKISKNSITGKQREVEFPIFYDYGIDDLTSMIALLIKLGRWTKPTAQKVDTKGDLSIEACTMDKLVKHIEENDLEKKVRRAIGKAWHEREESLRLNRKRKY